SSSAARYSSTSAPAPASASPHTSTPPTTRSPTPSTNWRPSSTRPNSKLTTDNSELVTDIRSQPAHVAITRANYAIPNDPRHPYPQHHHAVCIRTAPLATMVRLGLHAGPPAAQIRPSRPRSRVVPLVPRDG